MAEVNQRSPDSQIEEFLKVKLVLRLKLGKHRNRNFDLEKILH